jgi:hypothetical protein
MMNATGPARNIAISLIAALVIGGIALIVVAASGLDVGPSLRGISIGLLTLGGAGLVTLGFYHLRRQISMPAMYWLAAGLAAGVGLLALLLSISS